MHSNDAYDRLVRDRDELATALRESREDAAAHLANVERLSAKAARTEHAEQQVADRDNENVTLAKELETALGVIAASSEAITALRRVVGEHIATGLRHPATPVRMQADVLRSDLAEAGFSVDGDVMVLGALDDLR